MKKRFLLPLFLMATTLIFAQTKDPKDSEVWEPVPKKVKPGKDGSPPSDAIILFDGSNFDHWESDKDGSAPGWKLVDGTMEVQKGTGDIRTKESFGDMQLHIEWRSPTEIVGEGQGRGNSGVFLQSRYEVQVLDSYESKTYSNGQAGSLYKQTIPLVNAMRPPAEWEVYDIIYRAPRFNADGIRVSPGYVTVLHNGIVIQNHVEIKGTTEYIGWPKNIAHGDAPIKLQDHGNPVRFRNIWVRKL